MSELLYLYSSTRAINGHKYIGQEPKREREIKVAEAKQVLVF